MKLVWVSIHHQIFDLKEIIGNKIPDSLANQLANGVPIQQSATAIVDYAKNNL